MSLLQVTIAYSFFPRRAGEVLVNLIISLAEKQTNRKKTVRLYGNPDLDDSHTMTIGSSNECQCAAKSKKLDLDLTP